MNKLLKELKQFLKHKKYKNNKEPQAQEDRAEVEQQLNKL